MTPEQAAWAAEVAEAAADLSVLMTDRCTVLVPGARVEGRYGTSAGPTSVVAADVPCRFRSLTNREAYDAARLESSAESVVEFVGEFPIQLHHTIDVAGRGVFNVVGTVANSPALITLAMVARVSS